MKKLSFIIVFVFLSILFVQAQQAKYVFYFIGDGMGVNQVLGTEMYRGELEGKIGVTPLLFTLCNHSHYFLGNQRSDRFGRCRNSTCYGKQNKKWRIRCEKGSGNQS